MELTTIEFDSSEIGTKEYWDKVYKNEFKNFTESGDIGDIWFGEDSVLRVISWLLKHLDILICLDDSILDIGCGNGITLSYLADEGFTNLFGIDYSEKAVSLAKAVAEQRATTITYEVGNIITSESEQCLFSKTFKICHDKGTYDAISLCPEEPTMKMESYIKNVHKILDPDGILILTSCNWTECELIKQFDKYFVKYQLIPTPSFSFGGKTGSKYTSIVFKKKKVTIS